MSESHSWTGSERRRSARAVLDRDGAMIGLGLIVCLSGCATTPTEAVVDKLDPETATTVMVLGRPVELFDPTSNPRDGDAFAFLGPFQTDRMGERALFLWVAAPPTQVGPNSPVVSCNGQPIALNPAASASPATPASAAAKRQDLSSLNLSRAPYEAPIPWSAQWYFQLPAESLQCLASADSITVETRAPGMPPHQFTVDRKSLASLGAFVHRQ